MPITYAEKNFFSKHSKEIARDLLNLSNFDNSVLLFKVLAHAMKNNDNIVKALDESIFENTEVFKEKFLFLLQHALVQATSQEAAATVMEEPEIKSARPIKEYTPKELSRYFGVSVVTIHNWLKQGRFEGIGPAGDNKHNHISEDTFYKTPAGKKVRVRDVVEMWGKQETESAVPQNEDNLSYYTRQIAMYEEKYHGEFEQTLGAKDALTPEEETDAQVWRYLLGRQKLEFRNSEE
ncbi:helix-turn-helix domain-containing protein [Paenibacillus sp. P25]|nr:helix-turn-helix domain-containing protein [Paenibacillus sp. P25]